METPEEKREKRRNGLADLYTWCCFFDEGYKPCIEWAIESLESGIYSEPIQELSELIELDRISNKKVRDLVSVILGYEMKEETVYDSV